MTGGFSWQNSIKLCPASFCTPRPNLPVTPGVSWCPAFALQPPVMRRTSFLEKAGGPYILGLGCRPARHSWRHLANTFPGSQTWNFPSHQTSALGTCWLVQWLRLHAPNLGGPGWVRKLKSPPATTKNRACCNWKKILHAATKNLPRQMKNNMRLPWRLSGKESACQCRRQGCNPWSRMIPHASEHLSLCTAINK